MQLAVYALAFIEFVSVFQQENKAGAYQRLAQDLRRSAVKFLVLNCEHSVVFPYSPS
jgi:hypothetical protein